jgi:hypothetical protein
MHSYWYCVIGVPIENKMSNFSIVMYLNIHLLPASQPLCVCLQCLHVFYMDKKCQISSSLLLCGFTSGSVRSLNTALNTVLDVHNEVCRKTGIASAASPAGHSVDQWWTACCRLDHAGSSDGLAVCRLDRCLVGRDLTVDGDSVVDVAEWCVEYTVPGVKVKVTLRLTVSQKVCLGVEPNLGLLTREYCPWLELELFLQPTTSRPVLLGIRPPFGTLDQILSCSFSFRLTITWFFFLRRPLWQENGSVVYSALTGPNNYTLLSSETAFPFCCLLRCAGTMVEVF